VIGSTLATLWSGIFFKGFNRLHTELSTENVDKLLCVDMIQALYLLICLDLTRNVNRKNNFFEKISTGKK
jgi:hypothetical protein